MQKNYVSINNLSPEARKSVRKLVEEINDSMTRIQSEKDLQKEGIKSTCERLGIDPKIVRKIGRAYYKANFNQEVADFSDYENFYELVMLN